MLDIDGIQAQGLLRNCQGYPEKHTIAIIETYFKLSRQMEPTAYFTLLTNAVYSQSKANELKHTLEYLGQHWFRLKESIKSLKLKNVPVVQSKLLAKDLKVNEQMRKAQDPEAPGVIQDDVPADPFRKKNEGDAHRDVDVLVKLLPFYDVDMTQRGKDSGDAQYLRRLLTISRSDAEMLQKLKQITTFHQLMNHYFDSLLVPDTQEHLVNDLAPCFFHQKDRVRIFLSTLHRLVWEYNFVNQTFVQQYRMLYAKEHKLPGQEPIHDLFIFGGSYALSRGQIRAIIDIIFRNKDDVRGLTLNFTRIQNHGVRQLCDSINRFKWKAIRLYEPNLYSLDLTNNFIDHKGIEILCQELFKIDP